MDLCKVYSRHSLLTFKFNVWLRKKEKKKELVAAEIQPIARNIE